MGAVIKTTAQKVPKQVRLRNAAAKRVCRRALIRAAHRGRAVMVRVTPADQGQLKNSWKVRASKGTGIGGGRLAATLSNDAPHAGIVEGGARPHPVSNEGIAALHAWVWRNRKNFGFTTRSGRAQSGKGAKAATLGIAYAIANRIKRHGQEPTFFVKDSMPVLQKQAAREVAKAIAKLANKRTGGGR